MLHTKQFRGSHTGQAFAGISEEMLETWEISKSSVHVVVRDNARNIIKGMEEARVSSLLCGAHILSRRVCYYSAALLMPWESGAK